MAWRPFAAGTFQRAPLVGNISCADQGSLARSTTFLRFSESSRFDVTAAGSASALWFRNSRLSGRSLNAKRRNWTNEARAFTRMSLPRWPATLTLEFTTIEVSYETSQLHHQ